MILRFLHRNNISPNTVKKYAIATGLVELGGFGVWATNAIMESQEEQEWVQEIMQAEIERAKNKSLPSQE